MTVIIAGGRNYNLTQEDYAFLDMLHANHQISHVLHGGATGADASGARWARLRGIAVTKYPADWDTLGRAAGPIRNSAMITAAGPDAMLIAFPGGRGTQDIIEKARKAGLEVITK
jgi:hypothetical protein